MADKTNIEWTDATWNIITGCTLVDEGCRNCYAAHLIANWPAIGNHPSRKGLARQNAAGEARFTGEVRFNEQWLDQPLRWKKPRRIFVCAHGDLFHESVPDEWIDRVFAVMALASQHTFQVLTKRPERAAAYLNDRYRRADIATQMRAIADIEASDSVMVLWPLPNVWLGTSISDQASADERIPHLLAAPAAVRFLSAEPLLGPVDLTDIVMEQPVGNLHINALDECLDWIICGGESGAKARPMHPDWARSLRDQCQAAGVAFFFKQWGEYAWCERVEGDPTTLTAYRAGKKAAGRLLDGRTWDEMPEASHE
jgi:protein gp37